MTRYDHFALDTELLLKNQLRLALTHFALYTELLLNNHLRHHYATRMVGGCLHILVSVLKLNESSKSQMVYPALFPNAVLWSVYSFL